MEVRRKLRIGGRRRYGGGERRRVRRMRRGNGVVVVVEAVQRSTVATAAEVQEVAKLHAVRFARKTTTEEFASPMTAATEASAMPTMIPEYLVEWRDKKLDASWELATDIAEDALRDFEKEWWAVSRRADVGALRLFDQLGSLELLSGQRDADGRTALHYVAGRGSIECAKLLLDAARRVSGDDSGAGLIDAQDKDGFTPLHLAAGYMHSDLVLFMLEEGADPELQDKAGRTVVDLTGDLWLRMPGGPVNLSKRIQLQKVREKIDSVLFEEVLPEKILEKRVVGAAERTGSAVVPAADAGVEYFVQWRDAGVNSADSEDEDPSHEAASWVPSTSLSPQLRADYENDIEYCDAVKLLDRRVEKVQYKGRERTRTAYLVEWEDGSEPTWEPLSHVTAALVDAYENSIDSADDQAGFEDELDELEDAEWAAEEARKAKEQRYKEKMKQATY